jgi:hypothetical protein
VLVAGEVDDPVDLAGGVQVPDECQTSAQVVSTLPSPPVE